MTLLKILVNKHSVYMVLAAEVVMSISVFRDVWLKLVTDILTARPMTDLRWTYQCNNDMIYRSKFCRGEKRATEETRGESSDHTTSFLYIPAASAQFNFFYIACGSLLNARFCLYLPR